MRALRAVTRRYRLSMNCGHQNAAGSFGMRWFLRRRAKSRVGLLVEELYKRGLALNEVAPDLHAGDGLLMFWSHRPVAPWRTEAWLAEMRRSLRPNAHLRMIENRFMSTESAFVDTAWWNACVDPTRERGSRPRSAQSFRFRQLFWTACARSTCVA